MTKMWFGLAASAIMFAALPGFSAGTPAASMTAATPTVSKRADLLAGSARAALQKGDVAAAIRDAEAAVVIQPNDADARALLGRAYLAAGRFASADTAFGDALTLDPTLGRAAISRALAQIALGQSLPAQLSLAAARGQAPEAEIGLALALLGKNEEALDRLQAAVRTPDADPRTRQNLAFALALEGRWNDAAAVAAQDVPVEQIPDRLRRWAQIAQLKNNPAMQVGALLGVQPVADDGQPAALALVVEPVAPVAPVMVAELAPPAPEAVPPFIAMDAPVVAPEPAAALAEAAIAAPAPVEIADAKPVIARAGPPMMKLSRGDLAVDTKPAMIALAEAKAKPAKPARSILLVAAKPKPKPARLQGEGKWVVQLGAFSNAKRTEAAWTRLHSKARYLGGYMPIGSGLRQGNATLYRLSIGGLATRNDATRLCLKIKASGGACFVRAASGERPMQWALRKAGDANA